MSGHISLYFIKMRFCSIVIYYCAVAASVCFVVDAKFDFGQFEGPDHRPQKCYKESTDSHYFGTQNKSVDGRPCYRWIDATRWMQGNLSKFQIHHFADEYNDHNHCRNFRLDTYRSYALSDGSIKSRGVLILLAGSVFLNKNHDPDPYSLKLTKATTHPFLHYNDEWTLGPWCYVQRKDKEDAPYLWKAMITGNYSLKAPGKEKPRPMWQLWDEVRETKDQADHASLHLKIEPKHCFKPCTKK